MLLNALILVTTLVPHAEAGADALARALPPRAAVSAPADSRPRASIPRPAPCPTGTLRPARS
ncbi:hypothetical protein ACU4GA_29710 [Methylobacterium oryzae CBMB20]